MFRFLTSTFLKKELRNPVEFRLEDFIEKTAEKKLTRTISRNTALALIEQSISFIEFVDDIDYFSAVVDKIKRKNKQSLKLTESVLVIFMKL